MSQSLTSSESRALTLLGQGINPEMTASAVGLSTSRISQLLSDPEFAGQVADLRYQNLAKHNERDALFDGMEDTLAIKLKDCIPFMMKPLEILKTLKEVNSLKRRGSSAPDSIVSQQEIIQLVMPVQIINQYTVNGANQVVKAGSQDLVTVQPARLTKLVEEAKMRAITQGNQSHVLQHSSPIESHPAS
jgi:hypothetical protein